MRGAGGNVSSLDGSPLVCFQSDRAEKSELDSEVIHDGTMASITGNSSHTAFAWTHHVPNVLKNTRRTRKMGFGDIGGKKAPGNRNLLLIFKPDSDQSTHMRFSLVSVHLRGPLCFCEGSSPVRNALNGAD